ncbi:ABC transporter ATP-binding protein [Streptomyces violaceoruber]|uniref:ABC-type quaternary amine transporter n=3 Tax=Streptomyces TaxID=1883 RepID=O54119_STRCO|nr:MULTISPECIES: ABC transporter ATP-binding protein [Streptomyces]MDX2925084.1 ABC transporter ATP-binding protein [Streptomyces sp. NRRL_B-16638]MDX3407589.1 ABC transporter ATP-binding protein [Streptomyces sp. ME02-6977A]MYU45442.1 ATP-binding cassette domain-containing protein [Streptomyces sp. SID7813]NSL82159.1 ABC transporter ATP-binding protein [Streptomyces coelicolor]PSK59821.1 Trehalose import ATP-binding protein SugC [Streptomyces sp. 111WW2]
MPELVVENIKKSFHGTAVLEDVNFTVADGEFFTLLGPSGCGKSTTLSCVAGLETPDSGTIRVGDQVFFDGTRRSTVPPEGRNLGLVFQSYALWPHMTVADNLALPLKLRKVTKGEQRRLIDDVLTKVDMAHLRDRYPHQLSGGQQQRVALARGIVYSPGVLLLDEPLSNLDAKMRDQARVWLKDLQREVGITTVYVTHDQVEAMSLSDRIAVFMHGHLQQVGTPTEIYETPATPEVAGFIGRCNLLEGRVGATEGGAVQVELGETGQRLRVAGACSAGSSATVGLRSERITLTDRADAPHDGAVNVLRARIEQCSYTGARFEYELSIGDVRVHAESPVRHTDGEINLIIRPDDCLLFPAQV